MVTVATVVTVVIEVTAATVVITVIEGPRRNGEDHGD